MLLVGTQPLRSQHPPLTALPLGSPKLRLRKRGGVEVWREAPGTNLPGGGVTLSGPGAAAGDEAGVESDGRARFFGCTEEQRREKQRGALRCVPSLSAFLNPPTLRPSPSQALSRRPPPARHQTAALATFFFYLFNIFSAR